MGFTLGIAQPGFPPDGNVLAQVRSLAGRARQRGVRLLVFPEDLMHPRELLAEELAQLAEPLDGPFMQGIGNIAQNHGLWLVCTICEENSLGGPPHNTVVVVDGCGNVRGTYRKCHLYDAHHVRESSRMTAGDSLFEPVRTPFCTLGLGICYDLRFPELARIQALRGCDLLAFPSAWHAGPNKELHWRTLLRARAIENQVFVAGACHGARHCVGTGHVFDPLGNELVAGHDDLITCDIDLQAVTAAHEAMPVFAHRRPKLYADLL